jgi:hypothetical protein
MVWARGASHLLLGHGVAVRVAALWPLGLAGVRHHAASDPLDNLRDDGVAESSKSVHPSGNPISHSTHDGFNFPRMAFRPCDWSPDLRFAVGVGHI